MYKARNENGTIVVYSEQQMKQKFNRFQLNNGSDVNLFYASSTAVMEEYGFFDVIIPTLMTGERLGTIYFDIPENVFAYPIETIPPKIQDELDAEAQAALDNDSSAQIVTDHKQNGQLELKRIWNKLQRLKDSGYLSASQYAVVSNSLFDALLPMDYGQWKIAQTKINATPNGSGKIATVRTAVKKIIDDYVTSNY